MDNCTTKIPQQVGTDSLTIHFNSLKEYDLNSIRNNVVRQNNEKKNIIRKRIEKYLAYLEENTLKLLASGKKCSQRHLLTKRKNRSF